ncbi:hypothetical protein XENOCAPTIV_006023 [Xenoophorus captivus]|uniref:RGS domain-containing protein n=1 Tax=Xenoophorus captivus TaxID=1517983 RepID=A0ABV0QGR3_9TELE
MLIVTGPMGLSVSVTMLCFLFLTGFLLFKDFCMNEIDEAVPQLKFYEEVSWECLCEYEKLDSEEERLSRSRQIYDVYIMKELLSCSHVRIHLLVGTAYMKAAESRPLLLIRQPPKLSLRQSRIIKPVSIMVLLSVKHIIIVEIIQLLVRCYTGMNN